MRQTNVAFIFQPADDLRRYIENALSDLEKVNLIYAGEESEREYLRICDEADIIVGWRPSMELLRNSKRFNMMIFPGAGAHSIAAKIGELNRRPKPVLINGHGNSYLTAQHTVAMLLSLTNKIIPHHKWMIEGKWRTGDDEGATIPLRHRHVGLLGYGAIGSTVHKFLSGFDLDFSALRNDWNKQDTPTPTELDKYSRSELNEFLTAIDILIIAVPVTSETDNLIGETEINLLGENSLLVNIARGRVVDQAALYGALEQRYLAGAAIDVWYDYAPESDDKGLLYPYDKRHPFHELDNVVLSPHRAASPFNDLERWDEVVENIKRYAKGRDDFLNVVDLDKGY